VVSPARSNGGQRLYSDLDVERLRLLRRLTGRGHGIGRLAKLSLDELEQLAAEEGSANGTTGVAAFADGRAAEYRSTALQAAQALDAGLLQAVLEQSAVKLGVPAFLDEVAAPLIKGIGHGWSEGTVTVGQEHLATAVFQRVLGWIIETFEVPEPGARILVATPPGQIHELGALLAAAAAASEGWDVIYLGANLPVPEILKAADQSDAAAVALSIVLPLDTAALVSQVLQVRQGLRPEVYLFLGGAGVAEQPERFAGSGVTVLDSLTAFRSTLRDLAADSR
jgi:methanogenic corrinoid protein MtbC1